MRTSRWIRRLRDNKPLALLQAVGLLTVGVLAFQPTPASAYEFTTGTWSAPTATQSTLTFPSGVTATAVTTGQTSPFSIETLGTRGWDQTFYTPTTMNSGDSTFAFRIATGSCSSTGLCTGLGTLTFNFSQPVRNPTLHFTGFGATVANNVRQSDFHAVLDLTTPGVTLSQADGNANFQVTSSRVTAVNDSTGVNCTNLSGGTFTTAAPAACGSVQVNGTATSLAFNVSTMWVANPNSAGPIQSPDSGEVANVTITLPQDFSDAPASYHGGQAPAHTLSNLTLGSTVDQERQNDRNATTSPFPGAGATGDDTTGTDDEDAFASLPNLLIVAGSTYSLSVPLSGLGSSARLCGWIDFNQNGTFETGERSCTNPAAGATSSTLSWTVPGGVTVGTSYARFRLGYTATQVDSATGLASSGEVEDYPIVFAARPQVILRKTTVGGTGGPFGFTLTNTTQTTGTVTTTAAGTPTQVDGDTGTGGTQAFTVQNANGAVTINESSLPAGWSLAGATCTDAGGATVGSLSGTTYTIPGTQTAPGAVVTCTFSNARPAISLTKTAGAINDLDGNGPDAGDTVPYTFLVTNSGQVPLTAVAVTDPLISGVSCPATALAVGASTTCTGTYTLTQADVNLGVVNNTATATGTPPTGPPVTATASATRPIPSNPAITLDKSHAAINDADGNGPDAGDTVAYSFLVTNTGNVTLTAVAVSDPTVGAVTCPAGPLAPGASKTCTATYTLTQADVNAGVVNNTATTTGTPPTGAAVTSTDTDALPIPRTAALAIDKQAGTPTGTTVGTTIDYTFVVQNTGNVTLTNVNVADPKVGSVSCPQTTLAPGAQMTCTATYALTQADIDAGTVDNTVTVTATPPTGVTPPTADDSTSTPITRTAAITLDKQSSGVTDLDGNGTDAGDALGYTFVVTNTGNVTLTAVDVTDPLVGPVTCPVTPIAPGESVTCTATYLLTQGDIDAGEVVNSAEATATPPPGVTPPTDTDTLTTPVAAAASLSLDKQDGVPSGSNAGDTITYDFTVTNTGSTSLTSVTVDDPLVGPVTCLTDALAPGESTTCTATYTITQADVDDGSVTNTATATGTASNGDTPEATDSVTTPLTRTPDIALDKQAGAPSGNAAGDTIDYAFLVTNTGNVTLTNVGVADTTVGTVSCPVTTLAPGESVTCTAQYTLTQTDIDAGHVPNTADATGTPPGGLTPPTATDDTDVPLTAAPALTLDKQAGGPTGTNAGDTIDYSFVVTNTGNVTLSDVTVDDPKVGAVDCPVTTLAPGDATVCTATYTLTQADVDSGHVANTATATGTDPFGTDTEATDDTDTPITAGPALTLDKQAAAPSGNAAGDTVDYSFVVTNSGNVTLTDVTVDDPLVGTVDCPVTTLAPGESTTCTATYTLTQLDVDASEVLNTATATGTDPDGVDTSATDTETVSIPATPDITLDKQAGAPSGTGAGDTIDYTFVVTNTGNVTLTDVTVDDPKVGTVDCPVTTLAPGESTTCTATYTLTQTDVDAGSVANTALVTGTDPNDTDVTAEDSTVTAVAAQPAITLDKQAGAPSGNAAGDTVDYSFVVTNTGNVTLTDVTVDDPKVGTVDCPVTTLAPGESTTCTASYTLTQADVDAGVVDNTATVTGTDPNDTDVSDTDTDSVSIPATPDIALDKQAGTPSGNNAGDAIDYTFVVTNTGNVTLTDVTVDDPKVGTVDCPVTTLAPGESTTCTASYTLTQTDVDAGSVANTATVTGTDPIDTDVTAEDSTVTPIPAGPAITLDKQAGAPSGNTAGDTVDYTFVVTNTGNVTLTDVTVDDPKVGAVDCPVTTLAPGESTTCTASYTLTQTDVDAGVVDNTATVTGTDPNDTDVTDTDTDTVAIPAAPDIALDKQAGVPSGNAAGDTIDYTFLVTNTGNVTLSAITVDDPLVGTVDCPVTTLAPGESTTCTATYTLTQTDVDTGSVANTATVTGTDPFDTDVTAEDNTVTAVAAQPAIALDKQAGTPSGNAAGDTVDYSFLVTNAGNVTLTGITVDDPKVGAVDCPATTLAPGESTTCTATYTLTQADVDAGVVDNTATVTGTDPNDTDVSDTDTDSVAIPATPDIALDKQAGAPSGNAAGDTVDYSFVVTNTGNVTLTGITVDDPLVGAVDCPVTTLAPGESTTCTASYTLTQTDVDAGVVDNTATVTGTDPNDTDVSDTDTDSVSITAAPAITLDKQAGVPSGNAAGDTVDYSFVVTNTGNVTLTDVTVDDPLVGTVDCPVTTLAPGESTTCTASYTLTQADVDAGVVDNTATVTGTDPNDTDVSDTDTDTVSITAAPAIALDKQAGAPSGDSAGDTIDYTFVVTNSGNVTLTDVVVDDPLVGAVDCPVTTLAPGGSTTCTATYTLTQADVDAGVVDNTATVTGTDPFDTDVTDTDSVSVDIPAAPDIALDKQAGTPTGNNAGDTIDYTFLVTNTGNVTLTGIVVDDPLVGAVDCPVTTLAPGASTTCTASYTLTQADVDAGHVANTALVTGTDPFDTDVTADDSTDTPIPAGPAIALDKQAGTPTGNNAGDTVDYSFVVTNTGNVTLTDVTVDDPLVGAVDCPVTTLAPGESTTCTATYTLTQADVDAGVVDNTATVSGTDPNDTVVEATDTDSVSITAAPAITLDKQAGAPSGNAAGDTVDYTFLVTNTGNVTLTDVVVDDPKVGTVDCPVTTLAPGESTTCTAAYTLTQADVDAGVVDNTATVTGTDPHDTDVSDTDTDSVSIPAAPAITLDKQAGTPSGNNTGDTIDYSFLVTNTGNVTLTGITVDDPLVGAVDCPVTTLAPGESTTCTASYTLTQADVDAGVVDNTATVSGTDPNDTVVEATDTDSVSITAAPAIALDKQAGTPSGNAAGDTVDYTFVVTNTGNVTLTGVVVDDPLVGAVDCPVTTLAPGESTSCTASYTLTQADVDAGVVDNTATVTGTDPNDTDVSDTDSVSVDIPADPDIALDKQAGIPSGNAAGDTIDYTFLVTNTGNVTLTGIVVDDPQVGTVDCPVTTLAPGESTTCTASYTLTQADVDAGHVANTATATGTDPFDTDVTAEDSTDTPIPAGPAITLDKQAGTPSGNNAGDTVDYSFVVTNTGNVTLTGIVVDDPKVGAVDCPVTTLAPQESTTCTATYTLTQADVDAGVVDNTATASGTDPNDTVVESTDTASVDIPAEPAIGLDKQAGTPSGNNAGDTIDYTFLVTNAGNVTLTDITVDDPKVGTVDCPVTTLAPGESTTCTATYTLTQADVDAGVVDNTATVTGTDPSDADVTDTDSVSVDIPAEPAITLDKQAGTPSGTNAGDTIDYSFVVTNTGNVTLTDVTVDDPKVGAVDCPVTTLAPGESTTCTATYTLTQADVDAGMVDNTATVTGTDPNDTDVTHTDSVSVEIPAEPAITLDKQAGTPSGNNAGDTIDYTFVVSNTGNVTLTDVTVDDPLVGTVDCPVTTLAPGGSTTCTATYTLTQADVDAGVVDNTATATGTDPNDTDVSDTDSVSVDIPAEPAITLDKQAGIPSGTFAGDTIDYTFVVTNTGNVTLTDVTVDDPLVGAVDCPVTTLAPGESTTCTAAYTLTQADVDAGHVANTATVTGTDPFDTDVTAEDSTDTPIPAGPAITLDKQAGVPSGNAVGDTIDFTFLVANTGNVTLTDIVVDDPKVGTVTCPATTLAPGEQTTCTATYTLTQDDIDAGVVDNTATVTGTDPNDTDVTSTDSTSTPIEQTPAIDLVKTATTVGDRAGETIEYTFTVTNTGNVTLTDLVVDDPIVGAVDCLVTTLAPTESVTCTATYTLTQADVDAGQVENTATASGLPPATAANPEPEPVTDVDTVVTPIDQNPSIQLVKSADTSGPVRVGDEIVFSFEVTNTGNITLTNVKVKDPMVGRVTCPQTTLAPGESMTCSAAPYTVTAQDVRNGEVVNVAIATGNGGGGARVSSQDEVVIDTRTSSGGGPGGGPGGGELPNTGNPVDPIVPWVALGMVGLGGALLLGGRRRREEQDA